MNANNKQGELLSLNPHGVSVVVPSYNHAAFISKCLHSIIRQTHPPTELIVIDDGSTDGSPQVIERALKRCSFSCELIVRANRGLSATLNEGLERSRGAYFAYLGSDDVWLSPFLERRVELMEARPEAVLAYGHTYVVDEHDRIIECTTDWARGYVDGHARQMLLRRIAPSSPTVVYRRTALEKHGWNERAKLEDYELYLRLSVEGEFAFDERVMSAWRQHGFNVSRNLSMMLSESLRAQQETLSQLDIDGETLRKSQSALRWMYAEEFARDGQKAQALGLMSRNLLSVPSASFAGRMLMRLLMPRRAAEWRRRRLHRYAHERYGAIQL